MRLNAPKGGEKMLDIIWLIFIISEFFMIIIAFYGLNKEYIHVVGSYDKGKKKGKKKKSIKKQNSEKKQIISNITEPVDTEEISQMINYVELVFSKEKKVIECIRISQNRIIIGRGDKNDIIIDERSVSRRQCLIMKRGNKYILKNFAKINITKLNGKKIKKPDEIKYGDIVNIGRVSFKFNNVY